MKTLLITKKDRELIEKAKNIIAEYYNYGKHHIGAALRTKSDKIFTAVHIEAYIGRVTVCAEAVVLGKAISEGEKAFDTIVAVKHPDEQNKEFRVVSPCGICRELISDYGENIKVIFSDKGKIKKARVLELLPYKFTRE